MIKSLFSLLLFISVLEYRHKRYCPTQGEYALFKYNSDDMLTNTSPVSLHSRLVSIAEIIMAAYTSKVSQIYSSNANQNLNDIFVGCLKFGQKQPLIVIDLLHWFN